MFIGVKPGLNVIKKIFQLIDMILRWTKLNIFITQLRIEAYLASIKTNNFLRFFVENDFQLLISSNVILQLLHNPLFFDILQLLLHGDFIFFDLAICSFLKINQLKLFVNSASCISLAARSPETSAP